MKKITDEMINEMMTPTYTESSEIPFLNLIGQIGEEEGYHILYWKWRRPNMIGNYEDISQWDWVYYVHITDEEELKISVYYDEHDAMALVWQPYYELYYKGDIERFFVTDEEKEELLDKVKMYLQM